MVIGAYPLLQVEIVVHTAVRYLSTCATVVTGCGRRRWQLQQRARRGRHARGVNAQAAIQVSSIGLLACGGHRHLGPACRVRLYDRRSPVLGRARASARGSGALPDPCVRRGSLGRCRRCADVKAGQATALPTMQSAGQRLSSGGGDLSGVHRHPAVSEL
jgi:hypothetical protein